MAGIAVAALVALAGVLAPQHAEDLEFLAPYLRDAVEMPPFTAFSFFRTNLRANHVTARQLDEVRELHRTYEQLVADSYAHPLVLRTLANFIVARRDAFPDAVAELTRYAAAQRDPARAALALSMDFIGSDRLPLLQLAAAKYGDDPLFLYTLGDQSKDPSVAAWAQERIFAKDRAALSEELWTVLASWRVETLFELGREAEALAFFESRTPAERQAMLARSVKRQSVRLDGTRLELWPREIRYMLAAAYARAGRAEGRAMAAQFPAGRALLSNLGGPEVYLARAVAGVDERPAWETIADVLQYGNRQLRRSKFWMRALTDFAKREGYDAFAFAAIHPDVHFARPLACVEGMEQVFGPLEVVRVDVHGNEQIATFLSRDVDPLAGSRSRGGYWVTCSLDGVTWEKPLYTGMRDPRLPDVALAELQRDSDADGLTDLLEARLLTNPRDADTDRDGIADETDMNPRIARGTAASDEGRVIEALLRDQKLLAEQSVIVPGVIPRERTVFVVGNEKDYAGIDPALRLIVLTPEEREAMERESGPILVPELFFDLRGERAFATLDRGAMGETYRLAKDAGTWTATRGSSWMECVR
jgi:hypothetical protein